jgi:hypothetical protein
VSPSGERDWRSWPCDSGIASPAGVSVPAQDSWHAAHGMCHPLPCSRTSALVRHARTAGDSAKTGWRGTRGWHGDIIQPWGHDRCGARAVKRRGRDAVYGCVILVTRETGRAEGEHHIGLHRHHDPPHVVGERFTVGGTELVIAVIQEDRRVGPVVIVPRRVQACQDDGSARTKSVAMQEGVRISPASLGFVQEGLSTRL